MWGMAMATFVYLGLLIWVRSGWSKMFSTEIPTPENWPFLSVLVPAHNEAENLQAFLPAILEQDYPAFELTVVLDRCTDGSAAVIAALQEEYPQLQVIEIAQSPEGWSGKKWAVARGVEAAKSEYIVWTDADCLVEPGWLTAMGQAFAQGYQLILGLGKYREEQGWLAHFVSFETLYTAFLYMGTAAKGHLYMAVGRNLGYHQDFYLQQGGMEAIRDRVSGDDDLLVNAAKIPDKTGFIFSPNSQSLSLPPASLEAWIRQKRRHISAGTQYDFWSKSLLTTLHGTHGLCYLALIISLLLGQSIGWTLGLYGVRLLLSFAIFSSVAKKIGWRLSFGRFPVLDLLYFIYNLVLVPIGLMTNKPAWT